MAGHELDVLVVGGGITGVGAALDATTRGLRVGLIEARDYAAGTSSKSSKLIHGGLRYLEMLDFGLVREALRERELLLTRLAPHLVKPVPFIWPLTHRGWERVYLGAGLALYDRLGGARSVPSTKHLSHDGVLKIAPGLRPDAFVGGVRFYDAQEDDARLVAYVARTAAQHGASLATRVAATGFLRDGERVVGVRAHDDEAGVDLEIRARRVLSAAGVWTDELRELAGARSGTRIRPSKGIHVVVPRGCIAMETGLLMRTEKSVLFIIPWGPHWIIGDTDTAWELDPANPAATGADIDYVLEKANGMLREPLVRADVEGVFVGLRPLVGSSEHADTTRLSRAHTVETPIPGLTTIAGGKYTTYRVMAEHLVDAGMRGLPHVSASVTRQTPIVGASGYHARWNQRARLVATMGLAVSRIERLLDRYGDRIDDLAELIRTRPELADPLEHAPEYLGAEVVYACTHEGALRLEDVLARRTRISFETRDRGVACAPVVAGLMAGALGWDAARSSSELAAWRRLIAAELEAEQLSDDASASAVVRAAT
ncbi:MAG: glycerol-3-phosphate dehydrogenase [Gaiellales bacterium]|nr:glycerol-3-phosphate dehydrogenase [Gaiellales bacterium]